MSAIRMFELASRACLNVRKSIIIPITYPLPQEWCHRTGCRIFLPREMMSYLGCLIGFNVTTAQEIEFLMGKVRKWLSHLSFVERIVLRRHVIRAMQVYHFMSMSLNPKSYKMLEEVSRNFLWGKGPGEQKKKSLVAWDKIAQSRAEGGLGFDMFRQ